MAKELIEKQLKNTFQDKNYFSRQELFDFFRNFDEDLKETTFRWKIYNLKKKHIISSVSRGLFTLQYKPVFVPNISERDYKTFSKIQKQFPTLNCCIWSTQIINEFMLHIPAQSVTILQVEKEAIEPVYDFLKEQKQDVFIQPEEKEIERYVFKNKSAIVLESLVTKSPVQQVNKTTSVPLEKLIIDLISNKKLFAPFQGSEMIHILNTAYNRYSIHFTTLFHYAKRRGKEIELTELLSKTDIPKTLFHD
jgi:hypothetical protein